MQPFVYQYDARRLLVVSQLVRSADHRPTCAFLVLVYCSRTCLVAAAISYAALSELIERLQVALSGKNRNRELSLDKLERVRTERHSEKLQYRSTAAMHDYWGGEKKEASNELRYRSTAAMYGYVVTVITDTETKGNLDVSFLFCASPWLEPRFGGAGQQHQRPQVEYSYDRIPLALAMIL